MGLFDTIIFQYKLPLPENLGELTAEEIQSSIFQTKSMENIITLYKVDESGQLLEEKYEGDWEEGDPNNESVVGRIGRFKRSKEWFEPQNYTGVINFYQFFNSNKYNNDYWYEADAVFINGKISEIKLKDFKMEDNTARKKREAEMNIEIEKEKIWRNKWYVKYIYSPYCRLIRRIFFRYMRLKNKLPPSYKVERFLTPW